MNVRLTDHQIKAITLAIKKYVKNKKAKLYLYGSRTRLNSKGGDIDLLLLLKSTKDKPELLAVKYKILAAIKNYIGDQKIDLLIATDKDKDSDNFLKIIVPSAVLLWDGENSLDSSEFSPPHN